MAVVLPHSIFIHFPKTGGTTVREAIRSTGIPWYEYPDPAGNRAAFHLGVPYLDAVMEGRITFTFLRDPVSWYKSFWAQMQLHPEKDMKIDEFMDSDFVRFVRSVAEGLPGALYDVYRDIVVSKENVDVIANTEILNRALPLILRYAGEEFENITIGRYQISAGRMTDAFADVPDEVYDMIVESEQDYIREIGDILYNPDCVLVRGKPADLSELESWLQ